VVAVGSAAYGGDGGDASGVGDAGATGSIDSDGLAQRGDGDDAGGVQVVVLSLESRYNTYLVLLCPSFVVRLFFLWIKGCANV